MSISRITASKGFMLGIIGCVLCLLSACTSSSNSSNTATATLYPPFEIYLTKTDKLTLPEPQDMNFSYQQLLRASYPQGNQTAVVLLEHTSEPQQLSMAVLSTFNIRLVQAIFAKDKLEITKLPILPEHFDPTQVLGDILLCFYPIDSFTLPQGWYFEENAFERRLFAPDGSIVYTVNYQTNQDSLENQFTSNLATSEASETSVISKTSETSIISKDSATSGTSKTLEPQETAAINQGLVPRLPSKITQHVFNYTIELEYL